MGQTAVLGNSTLHPGSLVFLVLSEPFTADILYQYATLAISHAGTMTFLHWLAGMVYIFYFASFVMLLREILRPGVLWFLRNLNDQNFHPIQEASHYQHTILCYVAFSKNLPTYAVFIDALILNKLKNKIPKLIIF